MIEQIVVLSRLSQDVQNRYLEYYETNIRSNSSLYVEPFAEFNKFGLRYPTEHIELLGKNIVFLPLEFMADYVDLITKTYVDENSPQLTINSIDFDIVDSFDDIKATTIGNMAYIAMHHKDSALRQLAEQQLNEIFVIQKARVNAGV